MKPHCVSLEMAKRLKDAGFPQEDSCWYYRLDEFDNITILLNPKYDTLEKRLIEDRIAAGHPLRYFAAPTVGELGEMLPHLVYTYTTEDMRNEADARAEMWLYLNKEE